QRLRTRVQVDHRAVRLQAGARSRASHGAAAGGEHDVGQLREIRDHGFLAITKARLALDLEDGRNRHAESRLELVIGVDEALAEAPRDLPPEGRLAGAHETDEEEVAAVQSHRAILLAGFERTRADGGIGDAPNGEGRGSRPSPMRLA